MTNYELVPASGPEKGEVASYLLALADEKGIDRRLIKSGRGGYLVPVELLNDEVEVTPFVLVDKVDDGSNFVAREADVTISGDAEGNIYLEAIKPEEAPEVDREIVRSWLEENGYSPAKSGALKKAHLEAYHSHHEA